MDKIVVASLRKGAGKTSIIVGMAQNAKKIGYMKPFGDRMVYKGKRLWDHDVALMAGLYKLGDKLDDICFGFDHSQLRYLYSEEGTKDKLLKSVTTVGKGKDILFIEGGSDLIHGTFVHLGTLSLAKHTGAKLIVVISGNHDSIVDDVAFLKKYLDSTKMNFAGVVINKVSEVAKFKKTHLPKIKKLGVNVIGIIPRQTELTRLSVAYLAERLEAKIITGENNLNRTIKDILVGAMSVDLPLQKILSHSEDILMITSGDRTDMIMAALESDTEAILLSNGILPPSNIISKAEEKGVPLLLVPQDTYKAAKLVDDMEVLLDKDEESKIKLLGKLVKENLDLKKL